MSSLILYSVCVSGWLAPGMVRMGLDLHQDGHYGSYDCQDSYEGPDGHHIGQEGPHSGQDGYYEGLFKYCMSRLFTPLQLVLLSKI